MKFAVVASLVLAVQALAGCTTTFEIPFAEAPRLDSGTVRSIAGDVEKVPKEYSVRLIPLEGQVLLRDATLAGAKIHPPAGAATGDARQNVWSAPKGWVGTATWTSAGWTPGLELGGLELGWMNGPLRAGFEDPYFLLNFSNGALVVPLSSVGGLEIRRFSPGKTVGLVLGLVGGALLVTLIVVASNPASGGIGGIGGI